MYAYNIADGNRWYAGVAQNVAIHALLPIRSNFGPQQMYYFFTGIHGSTVIFSRLA